MTHPVYTVRAHPRMVNFGEFKGYIDHIDFLATQTHPNLLSIWSKPYDNDGMLPEIFCHLMAPEISAEVLTRLRGGQAVHLPGRYTGEQLAELGFDDLDDLCRTMAGQAQHFRLAS